MMIELHKDIEKHMHSFMYLAVHMVSSSVVYGTHWTVFYEVAQTLIIVRRCVVKCVYTLSATTLW